MKMIGHQAPSYYLTPISNIFLAKCNKMQVVVIAEEYWLFIIASVIDMV
jgi:hypothetical protein